jgi:hypothetical protein
LVGREVPIDAYLHIDFLHIFLLLRLYLHVGNEVFLDDVQAVEFLDGEEVSQILNSEDEYDVELFLSFENGLLGLVGGAKQLPAWEFREDDVQFKFVD